MATVKPKVVAPPSVVKRGLQAPTRAVHGGITGQKMQPVTRGGGQGGGGDKSNGGGSK
jgi:hypothetical protein